MLVAISGPTASGKSALGLELVDFCGGAEHCAIIGADAMQLYRGMDVGTAKTPLVERRGIEHRQIDVLEVTEEASVAAYQQHARADVAELTAQGMQVLVVGGSGLYLRALLDQLAFPATDAQVRRRLEEEADQNGVLPLYARLAEVDPLAAKQIHPNNRRRIIRALEVIELTGQPFSATLPKGEYVQPTIQIGIMPDLEELDQRIRQRTEKMFADGLIEETRGLLEMGLREGKTASRATGYAEAIAVIENRMSEAEAIESVALATRQLSRRQIKWFRRDQRIHWLAQPEAEAAVEILQREMPQ